MGINTCRKTYVPPRIRKKLLFMVAILLKGTDPPPTPRTFWKVEKSTFFANVICEVVFAPSALLTNG